MNYSCIFFFESVRLVLGEIQMYEVINNWSVSLEKNTLSPGERPR